MAKLNLNINRAFIPGAITIGNIYCGFLSIVYSMEGNFVVASWLIVLAAVFDALDGSVARLTKSYSKLGIELDSLSDVVSFGVAPSILLYSVYFNRINNIGVLISFVPLFFGAIRLARFNTNQDSFEKKEYTGLPIPTQAVAIASFVVFTHHFWGGLHFTKLLAPMVIFLGILMISNVEYDTFPKFNLKRGWKNDIKLFFFIVFSLGFMLFPSEAIFPIAVFFILHGVARSVLHTLKHADDILDVTDY
ncbi:CDP-alcohol phosphatidyltransferase [bacterium BMS3Abin05]|nr:CDP-alcohol phosphatidyltransferase [bacterium BMS3Abin05]GBE26825.1 CDP-alcohol phosphatidyltransferase [bacterium BMS3Bbin03]